MPLLIGCVGGLHDWQNHVELKKMAEITLAIRSETEALSRVLSILSQEYLFALSISSFDDFFNTIALRFHDVKHLKDQQSKVHMCGPREKLI